MVDDRRRAAGRSAPDDILARARALQEQLRAGLLDRSRLQAAALLGDAAAQALCKELGAEAPVSTAETPRERLGAFEQVGAAAQRRVVVCVAALALERTNVEPLRRPLEDVLAAARAYALDGEPAREPLISWRERVQALEALWGRSNPEPVGPAPTLLRLFAMLISQARESEPAGIALWLRPLGRAAHRLGLELEAIEAALRREVLPWTLGEGDPLAELGRGEGLCYDPALRYAVGQRLEHPTFGPGVVRQAESARIVVRFDDGEERSLAQGRRSA